MHVVICLYILTYTVYIYICIYRYMPYTRYIHVEAFSLPPVKALDPLPYVGRSIMVCGLDAVKAWPGGLWPVGSKGHDWDSIWGWGDMIHKVIWDDSQIMMDIWLVRISWMISDGFLIIFMWIFGGLFKALLTCHKFPSSPFLVAEGGERCTTAA